LHSKWRAQACGRAYSLPLVIKGVCGYADSHKSKKWQNYAAATAAKDFLGNWKIGMQFQILKAYTSTEKDIIDPPRLDQNRNTKLEILKRLNKSPYRDEKTEIQNESQEHVALSRLE
jgi:hypothetical protein